MPALHAPNGFADAKASSRVPSFATLNTIPGSPALSAIRASEPSTPAPAKENGDSGYLASDHTVLIKSKIVCTIGPKTQPVEAVGRLIEAGLNVIRMNFSHGDHEFHGKTISSVREYLANRKSPKHVAILLDTKGPEIRTGKLADSSKELSLKGGQIFTWHNDRTRFVDETSGWTTYDLSASVVPGNRILVGDGLIGFEVLSVNSVTGEVVTRIENDGLMGSTKGVNLPGVITNLPAITEKDEKDILFGVAQRVDFIAASFIRKAADVNEIRALLGKSGIKIISKIENQEGLDNFDEILEASDGIMVARGDLGTEIPVEQVARAQKMMIRKCNFAGKPVITATQMLESMIVNPRPTRAEATDVANAVLDGTDCVMLSGETAKGSYPVEAVEVMARICREAEADINYADLYPTLRRHLQLPTEVAEGIASCAVKTSWDVHAALIIVVTSTGASAQYIAKYRPIAPVLAITTSEQTARQCGVLRGVYPLLVKDLADFDNVIHRAMLWGVKHGMTQKGDPVVVTSGRLTEKENHTNMLRVMRCAGFET